MRTRKPLTLPNTWSLCTKKGKNNTHARNYNGYLVTVKYLIRHHIKATVTMELLRLVKRKKMGFEILY